jgi:4-amino-4-deoxy-L-arabinose transferase-like glycosyltransferase
MSPHIEGARQVPRSTAPNQAAEADVGAKRPGTAIALILGTMVGFLAVVGLFWIGPLGSDDSLYWEASSSWLKHVPFVGGTHHSLRHTLVIPLALSRLALGDGLPALVLPTIVAALALVVVLVLWTWRVSDGRATLVAAALLVTNPLLVALSSAAWIDPVELLFVFAAVALTARAFRKGPSWVTLLSAGMLAGLALMSRETTIFALAALGLLFVAGYGMERRWYLVIGLGFLAVVGAECAFYWVTTGNPLYRYVVASHHDITIDRWVAQGSGTPALHPLIDPVIMLLLSHYFGLIFWVGLPLSIWLVRRGNVPGPARQLVVVLGVLSLVWAIGAASLWQQLTLVPRYYMMPALGVSILAALATSCLWQRGQRRLAVTCVTLLVIGNLLGLAGENRNFMFGERVLVGLTDNADAVIHTDPQTLRRAELMLEWRGAQDRVTTSTPAKGDLYFYNPTRVDAGFRPGKDWTVIDRRAPPPSVPQRIMQLMPAGLPIPAGLLQKLGPGHPGVILYRTG